MNNHGSISLKNSSEINKRLKFPVSATANSTIKIKDGNSNLSNNIILTEVTASDASVAAARATAKAASIATSAITNDRSYLTNGDPLDQSVVFQISTLCTIQRAKSDDNNSRPINSKIQTDTVKSLNQKMLTNNEIENVHVAIKPHNQNRVSKFEKLRRELESLEQKRNIPYTNGVHNTQNNDFRYQKPYDNSIHSNISTLSSGHSDRPNCFSVLSEPINYLSDSSNAPSFESKMGKYSAQRSSFLSTDNESSDNSSNIKKYRISELKRNSKIFNADSAGVNNKDLNSIHCLKTGPGMACLKSVTINEDLGALLLSSSLPETDIDSGTVSENYFFPQTDFSGDPTPYSFEKTRSLVDLRKNNDVDFKTAIPKTISTEDLKKPKHVEECDLIKHLKSRAQSTQELRIADSLTKLNVPEWMNDFKLSSSHRREIAPQSATPKFLTMSYKNLKHHDNILSKYKYTSLPLHKSVNHNRNPQPEKVVLPSALYRSKSQNLVFFNPKEDSKLRTLKKDDDEPVKYLTNLKLLNNNPLKSDSIPRFTVSNKTEIKADVHQTEIIAKPASFVSHKEIQLINSPESDNIVQLTKTESESILKILIHSTQTQLTFDEKLCESFGINPSALKLLLNVKRKTPNLDRDETHLSSKKKENAYIENPIMNNDKNKNYIVCSLTGCGKEILHSNKIDRSNCSCYNCYTYYCSKMCRNYDFSFHLTKCSFNRIRQMLLKVKEGFSNNQLVRLSNFALENYAKHGDGVIVIAFESCRAADDFLNGQLNRMLSQPFYLSHSEIKKSLPSWKITECNSHKEYVISIIICATLPMTSIESSYPTYKCTLKMNHSDPKQIINNDRPIGHSNSIQSKTQEIFKELEARKKFVDYVINFFKAKNVQLTQSHPMIYNKLKKHLDDGIPFESLKIFIKDPVTNCTVACVINVNKEISTTVIRNISKKSSSAEKHIGKPINNNSANKVINETEI